MKNKLFNYLTSLIVLLFISFTFTQCEADVAAMDLMSDVDIRGEENQNQNNGNESADPAVNVCTCINDNYELEALSDREKEALLFMVEEEKLSRDVYLYLYNKWDHRVFDNISQSEQKHMNAVSCLITRYELENPVNEDIEGQFENTVLAGLFTELTEKGSVSLEEAFLVGGIIEDLDIADLMAIVEDEEVDNKDVIAVFTELTRGSRNHLRAFVRNLQSADIEFTPQKLSEELFAEIISSEKEKGGNMCEGNEECKNNQKGNRAGDGTCDGSGKGKKGNSNGNCDNQGSGSGSNGNCDNQGSRNRQGN